jgi:hypothetical protein
MRIFAALPKIHANAIIAGDADFHQSQQVVIENLGLNRITIG